MKIGLIDVDGHNFLNPALMKLSAWNKAKGDEVEWWWGFGEYNLVYMSKVFDNTYSPDIPEPLNAHEIIKGGTGYGMENCLPDEVEHIYPDYSLYPMLTQDTAYGFLTRGCPRGLHARVGRSLADGGKRAGTASMLRSTSLPTTTPPCRKICTGFILCAK